LNNLFFELELSAIANVFVEKGFYQKQIHVF